jgi:phosphoribosyl-ATP pyrophosphohydrolase
LTLDQLFELVRSRRENAPAGSYTARLFAAGEDEIVKKVGEEAIEVILAVKGQGDIRVVEELADLYYHSLVLLAARGLSLADVEAELERRHASRSTPPLAQTG